MYSRRGLVAPNCSAISCFCLAFVPERIEFLLKSLPLQQEHWVYNTRKVEELFTYWVAGLQCPASLTYSQDEASERYNVHESMLIMRCVICPFSGACTGACTRNMIIISYDNYYDSYHDHIIAENLPSTITNSANYVINSVNKQAMVVI